MQRYEVKSLYKRHCRVRHPGNVFVSGKARVNGLGNVWGGAKTRPARGRGIRQGKFLLRLKETGWRFNHRHENLYLAQ